MLNNITKTVNATAQSTTLDKETLVVSYTGYVDNSKQPTINRVIRNATEYLANRDVYDADYEEFTDYVMSFITD